MKLVKLGAIDSTNDYLKDLARNEKVENFIVVTAEYQSKGKGQMGSVWSSEMGKNIIMSVLVQNVIKDAADVFNLNIVVSLSVIDALSELKVPQLSVKWPNDIMSDNKKLGGILIENSFKSDNTIDSVVGLGLNVNQVGFENLPQATSIYEKVQQETDRDALLLSIIAHLERNISEWHLNAAVMKNRYTDLLFRKDTLTRFEKMDHTFFLGYIRGIAPSGSLLIENTENGTLGAFDIKEIKMIY